MYFDLFNCSYKNIHQLKLNKISSLLLSQRINKIWPNIFISPVYYFSYNSCSIFFYWIFSYRDKKKTEIHKLVGSSNHHKFIASSQIMWRLKSFGDIRLPALNTIYIIIPAKVKTCSTSTTSSYKLNIIADFWWNFYSIRNNNKQ